MNKKLKQLTWKFFWQQKWEETRIIFYILLFVSIFMFLTYCFSKTVPGELSWQGIVTLVIGVILLLIISFYLIWGALYMIRGFIRWLRNNYEFAEERAIKEISKSTLNKKNKGKVHNE